MSKFFPIEHKWFADAAAVAKEHGLEYEFVRWYKVARRNGDSVMDAIWYAVCVWDL